MSARASFSNIAHLRTPRDQRGALWWLEERGTAEQAVTLASRALDAATSERERALWSRLLDERMDHLEAVEDECDRIVSALRKSAQPWVAVAVDAFWLRSRTLTDVAEELGLSYEYMSRKIRETLGRLG